MKVRGTDAGLEQYADYFAILRYNLTQDSSQDSSIEAQRSLMLIN